ncbi:hypothetical protein M0813_29850 [Anaeramoeba flamelloides]|uniref:Rap-GAP domain-containing protein n=1 Tax=Anaeramoeba flamelloides TaxID=1746091 RepID=A0ABQ8XLM6_9EUKA|nr:hypothetical protein M0813_29850 [Anaeramoeba flamelloides]
MFLQHIEQVTSLKQNPESNVLATFPQDIKCDIVDSVLRILLDPNRLKPVCISKFSIQWVMECTGQAFSLPLANHKIIQNGITLYAKWLNEESLPLMFHKDKNRYCREIFGHLSLLFEPRFGIENTELETTHVNLCLKVINIISTLGDKFYSTYDNETVEFLLDILVGITDSLLSGEGSRQEPLLTHNLTPHVLKLLFDLWFKSNTTNIQMWNKLKKAFVNWRHRSATIIQWSATSHALVNSLINQLYGPHEGNPKVIIQIPPTEFVKLNYSRINLEKDGLIFFYHKTLHMINNPNEITDPEIFSIAMNGIRDIVNCFLRIGNRSDYGNINNLKQFPDPPTGNSILHIFAKWLFEATNLSKPGFEEGIECAYSVLCNIFMSVQKESFLEIYLLNFYQSIISALLSPKTHGRSICAILLNTTNIFSTKLEGVLILLPYYIKIIEEILVKKQYPIKISVNKNVLRKACINLIKSLVFFPQCFPELEIQTINNNLFEKKNLRDKKEEMIEKKLEMGIELEKEKEGKVINFKELTNKIFLIILESLNNETDPYNVCLLLWTFSIVIHEAIDIFPEICSQLLYSTQLFLIDPTLLTNTSSPLSSTTTTTTTTTTATATNTNTTTTKTSNWPIKTTHTTSSSTNEFNNNWPDWVIATALNSLDSISSLTNKIQKIDTSSIPNIVSSICKLIKKKMNELLTSDPEQIQNIICKCYHVIGGFIINSQWLLKNINVLKEVMNSIKLGISSQSKFEKKKIIKIDPIPIIKQYALDLFSIIFKQYANFPIETGPSNMSTLITEQKIQKKYKLTEEEFDLCASYYCLDKNRILTIIDKQSIKEIQQIKNNNSNINKKKSKIDQEPNIGKERGIEIDSEKGIKIEIEIEKEKEKENKNEKERINQKDTLDQKKLLFIIRDFNGRYAWKAKFRSLPLNYRRPKKSEIIQHIWKGESRPPEYKIFIPLNQNEEHEEDITLQTDSTLLDYLKIDDETKSNWVNYIIGIQHRIEEIYRYIEEETNSVDIGCQKPTKINSSIKVIKNKDKLIKTLPFIEINLKDSQKVYVQNFSSNNRLFLTNIGLMKIDGEEHLEFLKIDNKFKNSIKQLDQLSERRNQSISVIYIGPNQNRYCDISYIFENKRGSDPFNKFISQLGWMVDLKNHNGYNGDLNWKESGRKTPYYGNYYTEVVFHVSTLINFKENNVERVKEILGKNRVCVVWIDDERAFNPKILKSNLNSIFLIIRPHYTGLFSITFMDYAQSSQIKGPLSENVLISEKALGALVRKTVIITDQELTEAQTNIQNPFKKRADTISMLALEGIIKPQIENFYSKLLFSNFKL